MSDVLRGSCTPPPSRCEASALSRARLNWIDTKAPSARRAELEVVTEDGGEGKGAEKDALFRVAAIKRRGASQNQRE